uniref:Uncharacterized protein n=1 Tax=Strigamia maritima TaxID=126957 RepID=T1IGR0_STRMM
LIRLYNFLLEYLALTGTVKNFFRQQHRLDVGQHTALRDGYAGKQLVQLLVVADSQLQMTRDDPRLLIVSCSITRQLKDFSTQVFHHGSQVHRGTGTNTFGIVALAQQTMDAADGKLETGAARSGLALRFRFSSFASA